MHFTDELRMETFNYWVSAATDWMGRVNDAKADACWYIQHPLSSYSETLTLVESANGRIRLATTSYKECLDNASKWL